MKVIKKSASITESHYAIKVKLPGHPTIIEALFSPEFHHQTFL